MIRRRTSSHRTSALAAIVAGGVVLAACGGDDPTGLDLTGCLAEVDLFPVPVSNATSLFPFADDGFLFVAFAPGFQFEFYGTQYDGVFLNTNGGMTFGVGNSDYEEAADYFEEPSIAPFWTDLSAGETAESELRANQMKYQACANGFVVRYNQLQDYDEELLNNTATVTLEANGKITFAYGAVLTDDLAVGVWDGTHTDDRYPALANDYSAYSTTGTGTILFDYYGPGPVHAGELTNRTITFNP